ncbi:glycosyltransferase family 61 protein [Bradyrhizobium sp. STM 3843]|uniref:glycosyltransferase family 61 protein n=1 Tax=Bradyrhizobium sp. STM 3843 TaxID=551947 RepID=UPI0003151D24|nr:glycosyltransferase family 61 protein [Bradyrhizobium sp. STM 3843]
MATLFWFDIYQPKNWLKRHLRPSWKALQRWRRQIKLLRSRMLAKILPSAAIDNDSLYPPSSVCEATPDWVSRSGRALGAKISQVDPACTVPMPLPMTVHRQMRRQFLMDQSYDYPETFVASVPRGRATNRGLIITPDGQFLKDVSTYFHDPKLTTEAALNSDWDLEPLAEIDASVAVLATDGASLYYHWLFQLLPRYELMRLAGIDLSRVDYFLVNSQRARFQRETLATLGIEPSRIIDGDKTRYLRARELIVPSVPLGGGCFRPWMVDFLRRNFLLQDWRNMPSPGRRLYISRGLAGYRRVLNEDIVIEMLKKRGFEVAAMETMSVPEQAAVMASCEVVIGPHGGGMSNVIFCSPGTKIIEIYSPELVATYFWKLSNQLGLQYYYMLGKGHPTTLGTDYPQSWDASADIEVDLEILEQTLTLAGI